MGSETGPLIRRATPRDVEIVARIHVASWDVAYRGIMPDDVIARTDLAYRTTFWAERLAVETWPVLLLEEAGRPVAFCHMVAAPEPGVGEITSIHVLPEQRGRGLGRLLLEHVCVEFGRRGLREVTLWVLEHNTSARNFYEKMGFRLDGGTRVYPGTRVPEVRYRVRLPLPL